MTPFTDWDGKPFDVSGFSKDTSIIPNNNEFAESFVGYSMYGLADLFSGFDAIWFHPDSRPLQAFHSPSLATHSTMTCGEKLLSASKFFMRGVHPFMDIGAAMLYGPEKH
ncbi:hypothetical protein B0H14DRAFT_3436679 [Mycena olivaceomarginata]|nr:hypothetical protein B0H14DRAFT_3436679 [Mycena olivaceomarginata]